MIFGKLSSVAISVIACLGAVKADDDFPTIEVVGNKFFYSNNQSQFYIRGIAYQQDVSANDNTSFVDPLADEDSCKRDLPYLTALNTNVLRVYALNTEQDHDACMNLFKDAGIYVIADLAEPTLAINSNDPKWDLELYDRYTSVVDMMQKYDNVLGFFAGNEVVFNSTNADSAPFVKAAIRDTKSYIKEKGYRDIPVGYSANDDAATRVASADFFTCGDTDIKADFYGINMYEWCGDSTFKTSGYQARTEEFSNLTVPIFFSEYGCNEVQPRKFTEIATIFSDEMTDVWSGGIVYMYYQEVNDYGLVSIDDDGAVSTMADYKYYSSEINDIHPTTATVDSASTAAVNFQCPASSKSWPVATALPPTPNQGSCDCMNNALECVIEDDVDEKDYEELFSYICGQIDCGGITGDGKTGKYGAFSFCSSKEQLSFVLNLYYLDQNKRKNACDFSGSAKLVSATTASSCSSVLSAAGPSGLGRAGIVTGDETKTTQSTKATGTSADKDGKKTTTAKDSTSTVSSISSTSKGGAEVIRSSSVMGFFGIIAALIL